MMAETDVNSKVYTFNGYRLNVARRLVYGPDGVPLRLKSKAFATLLFLVENPDRVVSRDELLSAIWPDTVVEENNLTQHISSLRRAFAEKPDEQRFIATVPGHGYRFVAQVRLAEPKNDETTLADTVAEPADRDLPHGQKKEYRSRPYPWLVTFGVIVIALFAAAFYIYRGYSRTTKIRTLAVLPFKPITSELRDEALEVGMADTLIGKLGGGEDLRVAPLAAVRRFNSPDQDPVQAGHQLGVEAVLDGGVQIVDGRVRVSVKLIRTNDSRQLWSGQFDEDLHDIFALQDSISQRVASALAAPLANRKRALITDNVEAYQLFMRGRYHANKLILPEVQKGIAYYEQAISLDPNFALAYVELANAYRAMVLTNGAPPFEMMPRSKAAAQKAVELDENLSEAWTALAFGEFWFDWDWESSGRHFKRALDLDQKSPQARAFYAHLLSNTGNHSEAVAQIRRAREIEPINLIYAAMEGQILTFAGRTDDSTIILKSAIDLDPNFWLAHLFLSRNYIQKQMWPEALAETDKAVEITHGNAEAAALSGYILGITGRQEDARKVLREMETRGRDSYVSAYAAAEIYLGLGERGKALDFLEKAYAEKDPLIVFLKVESRWDSLRSEQRFIELARRLKLD